MGKEEIIGLLMALRAYAQRDHMQDLARWMDTASWIATELTCIGLCAEYVAPDGAGIGVPVVHICFDAGPGQAREVVYRLRSLDRPVYLNEAHMHHGLLTVHPVTLRPGEYSALAESVEKVWRRLANS